MIFEFGNFMVCFWLMNVFFNVVINVVFDWKIGVVVKDWVFIVKKDKFDVLLYFFIFDVLFVFK